MIFRFDNDGPVNRTSFAFERVAADQQKKHEERDHRGLADGAERADRASPKELAESERRLVDDDVCGRLARRCGLAANCVAAFSTCVAAFCMICIVPSCFTCRRASPSANRFAASGTRSMIVCIWPRSEYVPRTSAPDYARHDDHGADDPWNSDDFEPGDEGIQRVGDDDAEQQWHEEVLRPRQRRYDCERRENSER